MAIRSSMTSLITRVRELMGDPAGVSQAFTAQAIQTELDRLRTDVRYMPLVYAESLAPGGAVSYHDYYANGTGDWEDDVVLVDGRYYVLTPATSDLVIGHWTFTADTRPPVLATGKVYDPASAAAVMLRQWIGRDPARRDELNDRLTAVLGLVPAGSIRIIRSDLNPDA
jgi:hypothetical protein